jgi:hypothetical protein
VDPLVGITGQPFSYANDDPVNGNDSNGLEDIGPGEAGPFDFGPDEIVTSESTQAEQAYLQSEAAKVAFDDAHGIDYCNACGGETKAEIDGTQPCTAANTEPSTPTGQRGSPMNVPRGTNSPGEVNGISYGGHAFDEMQSEGFTPSMVEDAIDFGIPTEGASGRFSYYSPENNISVVTENGKVVTVSSGNLKVR